jgi:RHH-type rel operon transcriptional repressor/antitoxin RelB
MPTTIRLSPDAEARLNQLAAKTGRTKAFYIRRLIEEHLEDIEDAYLADQALAEFKASGEKAIPHHEMVKRLVEEHLEDIEDAYLADQALAKFRASGEKSIPFDEVCKQLGLDD